MYGSYGFAAASPAAPSSSSPSAPGSSVAKPDITSSSPTFITAAVPYIGRASSAEGTWQQVPRCQRVQPKCTRSSSAASTKKLSEALELPVTCYSLTPGDSAPAFNNIAKLSAAVVPCLPWQSRHIVMLLKESAPLPRENASGHSLKRYQRGTPHLVKHACLQQRVEVDVLVVLVRRERVLVVGEVDVLQRGLRQEELLGLCLRLPACGKVAAQGMPLWQT